MAQNAPNKLIISYDIACQWSRNLRARCNIYGTSFGLCNPFERRHLRYALPSMSQGLASDITSGDSTFLRKAHEAITQREEHVLAFQAFNDSLPEGDVVTWSDMVHNWENAQTEETTRPEDLPPNPFKATNA
ncbi:hypothetical protein C0992_010288, partial [Termitomyces sp. T32_za158]